jgi:cytochrome c oxidase subunit 3
VVDLEGASPLPSEHATPENLNNLGMWLFLSSEVMFFGALFTAYVVYRFNYPVVFAEASRHLDLPLGTTNTAVLLTSSLTMALAVNAAQRNLRRRLVLWMLATMVLGLVFLGIKGFEYAHKIEQGLFPGGDFIYPGEQAHLARLFFSLYFTITGLHAAHMVIGLLIMAFLAFLGWRGRFTAANFAPVDLLGLYWHFVDVVWIFVFPLFYLISQI